MPKMKPEDYRVLVKIFEAIGFRYSRQRGDHLSYKRKGTIRPIVIVKDKAVPVSDIQSNMRTAGLSRDEYFDLLHKVKNIHKVSRKRKKKK